MYSQAELIRFKESELNEKEVCRFFRHTTMHGAIKGKTQNKEEDKKYISDFDREVKRLIKNKDEIEDK